MTTALYVIANHKERNGKQSHDNRCIQKKYRIVAIIELTKIPKIKIHSKVKIKLSLII
jgi:hypothetical protein